MARVNQLVYTTSNWNPCIFNSRPAFFASSTPSGASGGSSHLRRAANAYQPFPVPWIFHKCVDDDEVLTP